MMQCLTQFIDFSDLMNEKQFLKIKELKLEEVLMVKGDIDGES